MSVGRKADIPLLTLDQRLHFASGHPSSMHDERGGDFQPLLAESHQAGQAVQILFQSN